MHLSSIILGPVVTEKAERLKAAGTYVLRVHPQATKVDVKNALRRYFDVEVATVRVMRTLPKFRQLGAGKVMEKRHRTKRVMVTLGPKSKTLDLASLKVA